MKTTRKVAERQRLKCEEKTKRSNVYARRLEAELRALSLKQKTGAPVEAFLCPYCQLYHIGKNRMNTT